MSWETKQVRFRLLDLAHKDLGQAFGGSEFESGLFFVTNAALESNERKQRWPVGVSCLGSGLLG